MADQSELLRMAMSEEAELMRQLEKSPIFRRLTLIRQLIAEYGDAPHTAPTTAPTSEAKTLPQARKRTRRAKKGTKIEETAVAAEKVIRAMGRPMQRSELYNALLADGVVIKGKDPKTVLATRLYHSGRFVNVEGKGFALKSMAANGSESKTADEDQSSAVSHGDRARHPVN